jgi:hypothetical protein
MHEPENATWVDRLRTLLWIAASGLVIVAASVARGDCSSDPYCTQSGLQRNCTAPCGYGGTGVTYSCCCGVGNSGCCQYICQQIICAGPGCTNGYSILSGSGVKFNPSRCVDPGGHCS